MGTQDTKMQETSTDTQSAYEGTTSIVYSDDQEIHKINGTPFSAVREKDEIGYCIGNYYIEKGYKTIPEAVEAAKVITWEKILLVWDFLESATEKMKQLTQENNV